MEVVLIFLEVLVGLRLLELNREEPLFQIGDLLLQACDLIQILQILALVVRSLLQQFLLVPLNRLSHFRLLSSAVVLVLVYHGLHRLYFHGMALIDQFYFILEPFLCQLEQSVRQLKIVDLLLQIELVTRLLLDFLFEDGHPLVPIRDFVLHVLAYRVEVVQLILQVFDVSVQFSNDLLLFFEIRLLSLIYHGFLLHILRLAHSLSQLFVGLI